MTCNTISNGFKAVAQGGLYAGTKVAQGSLHVATKAAHGALHIAAETADLATKAVAIVGPVAAAVLGTDAYLLSNGTSIVSKKNAPISLFGILFPQNHVNEDLKAWAGIQTLATVALLPMTAVACLTLHKFKQLVIKLDQSF